MKSDGYSERTMCEYYSRSVIIKLYSFIRWVFLVMKTEFVHVGISIS